MSEIYQLRRVGLPATVTGVKDVMKLTSEVTRFGRHSGNDYFLDSTETLLLVSRWHAEIHRMVNEGRVQYIIRDSSLNGTYVNDVRVKGNHVLKDDDTITFGHKMGRDIEPGQYAPQPNSEFRFIFERATEGDSGMDSASGDHSIAGGSDGTVVLKDVSNNSKRRTNEGLLPLDCLIDAGTAILSTPDHARRGGASAQASAQAAKRVLATAPKVSPATLPAATRPKMSPASSQRSPSASSNKGRSSAHDAGDASFRKRATKQLSDMEPEKRTKKKKLSNDSAEDWSFHQEAQRCDFYDCRTPIGDTVSWVQCDDCDKWYHTVCVGCSYDVVRNDNAEFHCGCI